MRYDRRCDTLIIEGMTFMVLDMIGDVIHYRGYDKYDMRHDRRCDI